jgi:hypothetical protein
VFVVGDVLAQNRLELPARNDQDPVETFTPDAATQRSACAFALGAAIGVLRLDLQTGAAG